jgi:VWFA-related protein
MKFSGPNPSSAGRVPAFFCALALSIPGLLFSLASPAQEQAGGSEITSQESSPTFRIQVERDLVQVRIVVRDSQGRAVGNLTKDDFRLTDNGKPQVISHFAVEIPSAAPSPAEPPPSEVPVDEEEDDSKPAALPDRYIAVFFDDVHMKFEDISRTRAAAEKYLTTALRPGDRVGIFTSSGEHQLDFTDDLGKLHATLLQILPRPIVPRRDHDCPEISDYQAYMMVHQRDPYAVEIAKEETRSCNPIVAVMVNSMPEEQVEATALGVAESEAIRALNDFQVETEHALRALDGLIRRMGGLPGQRTIALVSPGFLTMTAEMRVSQLIERALRANVVVNSLDAKGLYAHIPLGDATHAPVLPSRSALLVGKKAQLDVDRVKAIVDVLRYLAHDTGGTFFTNNNDFDEGFRRVGALPEVYYVLAFSPQNMKFDGNYHRIKVSLTSKNKYTIQARRGYYAPEKPADPVARAKEEIEQAIFSQDEVRELPMEVHTQFFKVNDTEAKLSVLTRLDVKLMHFRKENGRNLNNLTLVTVLFDRDGKYLAGKEKRVEFRLLDPSFEKLSESGITSKTIFDVSPGTYTIRQVVRDSEGAQLSALNKRVDIPL